MHQTFHRRRATRAYLIFATAVLSVCIAFSVTLTIIGAYEQLMMAALPFTVSLLLFLAAHLTHRASLEIDGRDIIFHYRVFSQTPALNRKHVRLVYDNIDRIEKLTVGKGTVLYRFVLTNGQSLDTYLYPFGSKTEEEILRLLENGLTNPSDSTQ